MKIAFDENISPLLLKTFQSLASAGQILGHEFVSAKDYRPLHEKGDENWIERFAKDGGGVIISGDVRIRSLPVERAALAQAGLITFFFESRWGQADGWTKSSMLMNWWPRIAEQVAASKPGDCWEIPFQWNHKAMRNVSAFPDEIMKNKGGRK